MKFKIGDRVKVYGYGSDGAYYYNGAVGVVSDVDGSDVEVKILDREMSFHKRQCRKLIKKPRRRVWILDSYLKDLFADEIKAQNQSNVVSTRAVCEDDVEFVEVRKAKKK